MPFALCSSRTAGSCLAPGPASTQATQRKVGRLCRLMQHADARRARRPGFECKDHCRITLASASTESTRTFSRTPAQAFTLLAEKSSMTRIFDICCAAKRLESTNFPAACCCAVCKSKGLLSTSFIAAPQSSTSMPGRRDPRQAPTVWQLAHCAVSSSSLGCKSSAKTPDRSAHLCNGRETQGHVSCQVRNNLPNCLQQLAKQQYPPALHDTRQIAQLPDLRQRPAENHVSSCQARRENHMLTGLNSAGNKAGRFPHQAHGSPERPGQAAAQTCRPLSLERPSSRLRPRALRPGKGCSPAGLSSGFRRNQLRQVTFCTTCADAVLEALEVMTSAKRAP